ncbi:lipid IV(A) 3-deoxy-D-manno-octulosonic acid transferase [Thiobacillus sp. 65-1402]|uniref:lipid IV(A) 3-deoxy-D-manno-octulosonic acid transferase n=1 Tax=Thiobacillus sp. 65-1402 TaxID=1895861 RepID=UPI00086C11CE|nr:lipid IV(A) 3-deoxy-D-manno-octulosonic acid transferase [Thiobacillus sp. 65-1402]ODU01453.1 MAG: 3-deoxy-D-manno-octulosonic acid transferase [Thiobacillus sp. SCN 63-1177]OJW85183.1 MAG: 3-deoxy-D-manno-octulosonic acid transferase [Thiobacillus sp. 65-1402]
MPTLRLLFDWTLYRLVLLLAAPLIPLRLLWRGRRERGYLQHWNERLALGPAPVAGALWIHAVSVGEMRAAQPLVAALRAAHPDAPLLLSCMTPTGRATAEALYGDFATIVYLPYDYAWLVRRFLRRVQPRAGILMETELWPNLIDAAARQRIPMVLANARLSARSARGYARLPALTRACLARIAAVAAQSEADAARLLKLGAASVHVTGNLKFDIAPPPALLERGAAWKAQWGQRSVLLAASTREGEEAPLLRAFAAAAPAGVLLVLVPRHPQRFDAVAELIESAGLSWQRRSALDGAQLHAGTRVLLGDSLGELFAYYAACDVAFVGGSLAPLGGQNLIEAASAGRPVLVGPHTFNFEEAARLAIGAGAALRVSDADDLLENALELLNDDAARSRMGEAGLAFVARHRGAAARVAGLVAPLLKVR